MSINLVSQDFSKPLDGRPLHDRVMVARQVMRCDAPERQGIPAPRRTIIVVIPARFRLHEDDAARSRGEARSRPAPAGSPDIRRGASADDRGRSHRRSRDRESFDQMSPFRAATGSRPRRRSSHAGVSWPAVLARSAAKPAMLSTSPNGSTVFLRDRDRAIDQDDQRHVMARPRRAAWPSQKRRCPPSTIRPGCRARPAAAAQGVDVS